MQREKCWEPPGVRWWQPNLSEVVSQLWFSDQSPPCYLLRKLSNFYIEYNDNALQHITALRIFFNRFPQLEHLVSGWKIIFFRNFLPEIKQPESEHLDSDY